MAQQQLCLTQTRFIISAPHIRDMPADRGVEIAFAGRSNAGKSTLINSITQQKNLAQVAKLPGRTRLINVFEVALGYRFIDLPGYGFAKVPLAVKKKWQQALGEYLQKRYSLTALIIAMDIRHPLRDMDKQLIHWALNCNLSVLGLLTKADKLSKSQQQNTINRVRMEAELLNKAMQIQSFSAHNKQGITEVHNWLQQQFKCLIK